MALTVAVATPCSDRAGLGNHAGLAHAFGEQDLPHRIVDLVGAGVVQVFALQVNFRTAEFAREAFGKIKRRGPADEFREVIGKFALKFRVLLRAEIFGLQSLPATGASGFPAHSGPP